MLVSGTADNCKAMFDRCVQVKMSKEEFVVLCDGKSVRALSAFVFGGHACKCVALRVPIGLRWRI